jgi:hypothetical protein
MSERADLADEYAAFDRFWLAYPRHVAKLSASRAFTKAIKKTTLPVMLAALAAQKATPQWQRGVIPNASTWLHQERWADDVPQARPAPTPAELEHVARIRERKRREFLEDAEAYYRTHPAARPPK